MGSKIIQFPRPQGEPFFPGAEGIAAQLRQNREGVVQRVRAKAEDPTQKFNRREDRARPAQEIARLMEENNIKPRDVYAQLDSNYRKLHLERLRLDPSVPPTEAKRKAAKDLDLRIQPYVQVLEAIAKHLDRSSDEILFHAFRETEFLQSGAPSDDERVNELNYMLGEMTRAVIRAEKLSGYFDQACKNYFAYDPVLDEFFPSSRPLLLEGYCGEGFDGDCWPCLEAPFWFPGVTVLRIERARFSGRLIIESELVAPFKCTQAEAARLTSPLRPIRDPGLGRGRKCDAEIFIFTDIRFVIGPRTPAGDLGPLYELRPFIHLKTDGCDRLLTFPLSVSPLAATKDNELSDVFGSVAARFDDGWHRIGGFGNPSWKGTMEVPEYWTRIDTLELVDNLIGTAGSGWEPLVKWTGVNVSTTRHLIEHLAKKRGQIRFTTDGPYPKRTVFLYPHCPELETALSTGAIEKAIGEECNRLKVKLTQSIEQVEATRNAENAEQLARWRNIGPNTVD